MRSDHKNEAEMAEMNVSYIDHEHTTLDRFPAISQSTDAAAASHTIRDRRTASMEAFHRSHFQMSEGVSFQELPESWPPETRQNDVQGNGQNMGQAGRLHNYSVDSP